jgi:hypothetical protein
VINLGSISVGNATLVVANVLTCNKHTPISYYHIVQGLAAMKRIAVLPVEAR